MSSELAALVAQLTLDVARLLPNLIRAIRDGNHEEAMELARRAALASAAKAAVRRGTKGVK